MLALSTNWNSYRHEKGGAMLQEIEALGFDWVELGHGIKAEAIPGVVKYLAKNKLKVCSLHNYCPLPVGFKKSSPDVLEFTAASFEDRKRATQKTKETIDLAEQLGANFVVLHLGSNPKLKKEEKLLLHAMEKGERRKVIRSKIKLVRLKEVEDLELWQRILECLEEVVPHASNKKIKLGIENRAYFHEFPFDQWERLWSFSDHLGYWHDFGHAQIQEHLSWSNHWEAFTQRRHRLIGCHFHDTQFVVQDHQPLKQGLITWDLLLPQVPQNLPWVLEYGPKISSEKIKKDQAYLKSLYE